MKVELVTNLNRQATKILAELYLSKESVLITEHGQPFAYLVDLCLNTANNPSFVASGPSRANSVLGEMAPRLCNKPH